MEITLKINNLEHLVTAINRLADTLGANTVQTGVKDVNVSEPIQQEIVQQNVPNPSCANPTQMGQFQQPVTPAPQVQSAPQMPLQQPVQTSTVAYTLDAISNAAMTLMDRGMQVQLQELLAGYGVESLPQLPADKYGMFATALRGLGAQI